MMLSSEPMFRLLIGALLTATSACYYHISSPPAGVPPLDSSAPLGAGKRAVGADVFLANNDVLPTTMSSRGTYRQAIDDKLEWGVAPALTWIFGDPQTDEHCGIYSARGFLKYAPSSHAALDGGLGGGYSTGGAFITPDFGFTTSYDNPYLVPFFSLRGFVSVPVARSTVYLRDGAQEYFFKPRFTYGPQSAVGLLLKTRREQGVNINAVCTLSASVLLDEVSQNVVAGFACGAFAVF